MASGSSSKSNERVSDTSTDLRQKIAAVAAGVPAPTVEWVAAEVEALPSGAGASGAASVAARVMPAGARYLVDGLLRQWVSAEQRPSPEALAWALRGAAAAVEQQRAHQSLELVWTGPTPAGAALRRTDQVLLDLVYGARGALVIVAFAAYRIPEIAQALIAAARRDVHVMLVVESAEESGGKVSFETITGIGAEVAAVSHVYVWPREQRQTDSAGRHGSLHAKCALADDEALLISSANLTEYALNLNMELGVLVRGGELPKQVGEHLRRLVGEGVLREWGGE